MITLAQITDYISGICPIISVNSSGVIEFDPSATAQQMTDAQVVIDDWVNGNYPQVLIGSELKAEKWKLVDEYELNLTVTLSNGHKYAANKNARINMKEAISSLGANGTDTWREEWGDFTTDAVELQQALDEAINLLRTYRNSTFWV